MIALLHDGFRFGEKRPEGLDYRKETGKGQPSGRWLANKNFFFLCGILRIEACPKQYPGVSGDPLQYLTSSPAIMSR